MVSYIMVSIQHGDKGVVLILVVVDDGLVLLFYVLIEYKFIVLILVVVDDGLVLVKYAVWRKEWRS